MNKCTLSIDWEDFGQLYTKYHYKIDTPPLSAITRQTDIILEMLDETDRKATFFILGLLAKYRPDLVKKIAAKGHEIAVHGQNHEILFTLNAKQIKEDISESIKTVSDITGTQIFGYRAPRFSINETNLYVLEILTELDLLYDSSIFPIKLPRYGILNFDKNDTLYKLPNQKEIVEIPLSTVK
jgi:polysaccharide deacetylase family protein (PEP-CTERM system associated)